MQKQKEEKKIGETLNVDIGEYEILVRLSVFSQFSDKKFLFFSFFFFTSASVSIFSFHQTFTLNCICLDTVKMWSGKCLGIFQIFSDNIVFVSLRYEKKKNFSPSRKNISFFGIGRIILNVLQRRLHRIESIFPMKLLLKIQF